MELANLIAGWIGILLGFVSGMISGLFFAREAWLGGYDSWTRRMVRLGHISFFGLGFINLAFALTLPRLSPEYDPVWTAWLFIIGAATMPAVCYLSAYRKGFRHLFAVPVGSLLIGIVLFISQGLI